MKKTAIIGAGLAGCECAYKLAENGFEVTLFEMKPHKFSPAHENEGLAELVCSNSLRSMEESTAIGLIKTEMRTLGSLVMEAADATCLPAGKALAVDRNLFSEFITKKIDGHELITLVRQEVETLDDSCLEGFDAIVVAAGPLASDTLAKSLMEAIGEKELYFYDAIAPIVEADSVDMDHAFWGSRYRPEDKDYLNCPLDEEQYKNLVAELLAADKVKPRQFEDHVHFEGCLPVEEMAERGEMTLAFGPLKPVGLEDPRTGERPFAVIQLRAENKEKTSFNLVGFQTKLTYPEQKRVFRMIPALKNANFLRLGSIHRNTFVNAPKVLDNLELKSKPGVFLAGQITGVEGYVESAACGLWLGQILVARFTDEDLAPLPVLTSIGALMNHLAAEPAKKFSAFQRTFRSDAAFESQGT